MREKKKIISRTAALILILALATGGILVPAFAAERVYPDVPLDAGWARPVYWATEKGYVQGFESGRFGPEEFCTRQQFVIIVWRIAGRPGNEATESPFSDTGSGLSGYRAIMWAVENGVIKGFDDGMFRPESPVTRGQVAMILWRMAGKEAAGTDAGFTDVKPGMAAYKPVTWGYKSGIIKGFDDGSFRPDEECTRAQIVTMFYRYSHNVEGEDVNVELPGAEESPAVVPKEPETKAQEPEDAEPGTPMHEPEQTSETVHTHKWEWVEGTGHYETVVVKEAWDEEVQTGTRTVVDKEAWDEEVDNGHYEVRTFCNDCGYDLSHLSEEEFEEHLSTHLPDSAGGWHDELIWIPNIETIHHEAVTDEEPVFETVHHEEVTEQKWIVDSEGHYECSCGAEKPDPSNN